MSSSTDILGIILDEFRKALSVPEMNEDDDFFDFGGHSLLATRILVSLKKKNIMVSFNDFFQFPTARGIASVAKTKQDPSEEKSASDSGLSDSSPLTFTQQFLWDAYEAFDFSPIYNLPFAIESQGDIDEETFALSFCDVVERHPSLRTIFHKENGRVVQTIIPMEQLSRFKWYWGSNENKEFSLEKESTYKFDLSKELPLRVRFVKYDKRILISLLIHHMVIDEWSLNTLMQDLKHAYSSRIKNLSVKWNRNPKTMVDLWKEKNVQGLNKQHLQYWVEMLDGTVDRLKQLHALSADSITLTAANSTGIFWDINSYNQIYSYVQKRKISIFTLFYSIISIALMKSYDMKEVIVGTSSSGRDDSRFFDTVGYFTTMIAHRLSLRENDKLDGYITRVAELVNESLDFASIPIDIVQKHLSNDSLGLIFDVYIHIHVNNALHGFMDEAQSIYYKQIPPPKNISMFGIHFELMDNITASNQHELSLIVTYQKNRYSDQEIEILCTRVEQILSFILQGEEDILVSKLFS
ncbi:condensation domain-containing protein [Pelistega sp. MC2]|uniref:condensation domain-containing protein n=1 Tax=Pelistega sp. MC2 TaxID=1720297 RepID=UPI0008DA0CFD|nr:condensation domain-containing protein [Pelistega sp. MC2]